MKPMGLVCIAALMATLVQGASNVTSRISRLPPDVRAKVQETRRYLAARAEEEKNAAAVPGEAAAMRWKAIQGATAMERAAAQDALRLEEYRRRQAEEAKR